MSLTFNRNMDRNALTVLRDGKAIGEIHKHPDRSHRMLVYDPPGEIAHLSVAEMETILAKYREFAAEPLLRL